MSTENYPTQEELNAPVSQYYFNISYQYSARNKPALKDAGFIFDKQFNLWYTTDIQNNFTKQLIPQAQISNPQTISKDELKVYHVWITYELAKQIKGRRNPYGICWDPEAKKWFTRGHDPDLYNQFY